jgi:hypothetical protein
MLQHSHPVGRRLFRIDHNASAHVSNPNGLHVLFQAWSATNRRVLVSLMRLRHACTSPNTTAGEW